MKNMNEIIKSFEPMMHKLLHKYNVKNDYEDYLQVLRLTVYLVTKKHNKIRGALSTLIYRSLENKLRTLLRKEKHNKALPESAYIKSGSKEYKLGIIGNYSRNPNSLNNVLEYNLLLKSLKQRLTPIEKKIVKYRLSGLNQYDIGTKLGKSQQRISQELGRIRIKFEQMVKEVKNG